MHRNTLVGHARFAREGDDGGGGGNGKPGGTEFKPPADQAEFDRIIQDRVRRATAPFKDYETLQAKASQFDTLVAESATETEKAANQARAEGFNEAMSRTVPVAVTTAFKAEAKGVLSAEQLESLLEDLNLSKYADDDGAPDWEKIGKKIAAFAPAQGEGEKNGKEQRPPSFGQGNGHQQAKPKAGEAGIAEAQKRFAQK